jgi:hypothetical protein
MRQCSTVWLLAWRQKDSNILAVMLEGVNYVTAHSTVFVYDIYIKNQLTIYCFNHFIIGDLKTSVSDEMSKQVKPLALCIQNR